MSGMDRRFVAVAAFLGLLIGIDTYFARWTPEVAEPRYERLPDQIGEWNGVDVEVSQEMLDIILHEGRASYFERLYSTDDGREVTAMVIYIDRPEALRHTPERCLTLAGWALDRLSTAEIPLSSGGVAVPANLITAVREDHRIVQLYLYVTADGYRRTALSSLVDYSSRRLTSRDQMMAHVILTTIVPAEADQIEALGVVTDFSGQYLPLLRETLIGVEQ